MKFVLPESTPGMDNSIPALGEDKHKPITNCLAYSYLPENCYKLRDSLNLFTINAVLGGDQLGGMLCHNSAATNLDKCPTLVVAMTTFGTARVMA